MGRVIVVMGVAGSGKSTIGRGLAGRLGCVFQEGDDLHPAQNVAKMRAGHPLTDTDRAPWLARVAEWIERRLDEHAGGVITCSALRRTYRDALSRPGVEFVHLAAPYECLDERLAHREGHFMPRALLGSQFDTLEPLQPDEHGIAVDARVDPETELDVITARLAAMAD